MSIRQNRRDVQRLQKRRANLLAVITEKAEERRQLSEQIRSKKERNPRDEERKAELHEELLELGREEQELTAQIEARRKRRTYVTKKLKKATRRLRRALARQSGPDKALKAAEKDIGKTEVPYGSNWGPYVSKVIRFCGYSGPVYWCGCAACWWVVKKALAAIGTRIRLGYAGYIYADAVAGANGLRRISSPQKGAIGTLWNFEHIVFITGPAVNGMVPTIEGNTSSADGSQSNGGGVFRKSRPIGDFDVFAMPNYS